MCPTPQARLVATPSPGTSAAIFYANGSCSVPSGGTGTSGDPFMDNVEIADTDVHKVEWTKVYTNS